MLNQFSRTELLFGEAAMEKLRCSRVAIFGVGGVGGHVVEALARSGVGTLDLIDSDTVSLTNINRQIVATLSTVGKYKVEVAKERIADINPEAVVNCYKCFYGPDTAEQFDFSQYDYVVDAIDTVTGKIGLIMQAEAAGIPIISSMGAGNKINPSMFEVEDIYKTSVCPLAKVMRHELKKRGIKHLKVVYSKEIPIKTEEKEEIRNEAVVRNIEPKAVPARLKPIPGSNAFVPSVAGLIIAGEVIKDLTGMHNK